MNIILRGVQCVVASLVEEIRHLRKLLKSSTGAFCDSFCDSFFDSFNDILGTSCSWEADQIESVEEKTEE